MSPALTPLLVRRERGLREGNEGRGALEWSIMVLLDAEEKGTIAVRVALFITCFNDTLFPETGQATVEVLECLGVEVDFPYAQTCCGQMHFNTGYQREAIPLVRRFVEFFRSYEAVVAPSVSCVGMVRELYPMAAELANDKFFFFQAEDGIRDVEQH